MFEWVANPEAWIALATLTALEIVLGIERERRDVTTGLRQGPGIFAERRSHNQGFFRLQAPADQVNEFGRAVAGQNIGRRQLVVLRARVARQRARCRPPPSDGKETLPSAGPRSASVLLLGTERLVTSRAGLAQ